jgi:hypothetical protein
MTTLQTYIILLFEGRSLYDFGEPDDLVMDLTPPSFKLGESPRQPQKVTTVGLWSTAAGAVVGCRIFLSGTLFGIIAYFRETLKDL